MSIEIDKNLLNEISQIIGTVLSNPADEDDITYMLDELVSEYRRLEEKLEEEIEQRENYYEPISKMRIAGMSERDFY